MKKYILICCLLLANFGFAAAPSPVGYWQTIDDVTGKARSVVQITEENGRLQGHIEKVFFAKNESKKDICVKCTGKLHNQPILGLTIMWGLSKQGNNTWKNGIIVDPKNGKSYRCQISLAKAGQQLNVRGYIGVPLLGRSQVWIRLKSA